MHSFIFNNRSTHCSDSLQYLVLRLPALTYSGLVDQAASPPIFFLVCQSRLYICLFWVFNFSKVYFQHLIFLEKSWGICSVLEGSPFNFWCPVFFGGGSEVVEKNSGRFHASWIVFPVRSHQEYPLLSMGLQLSNRLYGGVYVCSCLSLSSRFSWGSPNLSEVLIFSCNWCPEKSYPLLLTEHEEKWLHKKIHSERREEVNKNLLLQGMTQT